MSTAIYIPPGGESGRELLVSNSLLFAYLAAPPVCESTTTAGAWTRVQEGEVHAPGIGRNRAMQIILQHLLFLARHQ